MGLMEKLASQGEGGGPAFIDKDERADLIAKEVPFTISAIKRIPNRFEAGEEQFALTVQLAGEDRTLYFGIGSVPSRDEALQETLDSDELAAGPIGPVKLVVIPGTRQAQTLVPAEA